MRKIIHIDMDCFFAAVEMRDNPALREVPLAIGGAAERRGVIATCNYPARRFGIHSAMSTAQAQRRCPQLVLLPGRMSVYQAVSAALRAILLRYTDCIEPLSLDEAYLDVSEAEWCQGSATRMAQAIRADIQRELGLTASAGVAPNKFLAKIASDLNKPDGLFVLPPAQVADFVRTLPLKKIPGIGARSAERLALCGLHTCADVQAFSPQELLLRFGKMGQMLLARCQGVDERPVEAHRVRKSVGAEITLPQDLQQPEQALAVLQTLLPVLQRSMARYVPPTAIVRQGIKLKFDDFQQTTVERAVRGVDQGLWQTLLEQAWARSAGRGVRLVGVVVGLPEPAAATAQQLSLAL